MTNFTPIEVGAEAEAATFNAPLTELSNAIGLRLALPTTNQDSIVGAIVEITNLLAGGVNVTDESLLSWAGSPSYLVNGTITRDSEGVTLSFPVQWPDGSAGVFSTLVVNATWNAIDSWQVTHLASNQKVVQAAVTRNADGEVVSVPLPTVQPI